MKLKLYSAKDLNMDGIAMAIIQPTSPEGDFKLMEYGKGFVPNTEGIMLYLEEKYIMDLEENFKLEMDAYFKPSLVTKEGINYEPPKEDELVIQTRELENQLRLLREEQQRREEGIVSPPKNEEAALAEIDREIASREA